MKLKFPFGKRELPPEQYDGPVGPEIIHRSMILVVLVFGIFSALLIRILLLQTVGYDRYQPKVIDQLTTESVVADKKDPAADNAANAAMAGGGMGGGMY